MDSASDTSQPLAFFCSYFINTSLITNALLVPKHLQDTDYSVGSHKKVVSLVSMVTYDIRRYVHFGALLPPSPLS